LSLRRWRWWWRERIVNVTADQFSVIVADVSAAVADFKRAATPVAIAVLAFGAKRASVQARIATRAQIGASWHAALVITIVVIVIVAIIITAPVAAAQLATAHIDVGTWRAGANVELA
jgi:hypothetical protein